MHTFNAVLPSAGPVRSTHPLLATTVARLHGNELTRKLSTNQTHNKEFITFIFIWYIIILMIIELVWWFEQKETSHSKDIKTSHQILRWRRAPSLDRVFWRFGRLKGSKRPKAYVSGKICNTNITDLSKEDWSRSAFDSEAALQYAWRQVWGLAALSLIVLRMYALVSTLFI